jgi:thiamine kinase-like enzyme
MGDVRRDEEAIAWAEAWMGGKVIHRELQSRWRPHWTLDMDLGDRGVRKILMRGYRNPGYTEMDHSGARGFLAREAAFLEALQDVPIKLPRYYGQNDELGWMLMEFLPGGTELTAVADSDRRFTIYTQYVEELAKLHAYPLDRIALPAGTEIPASCQAFVDGMLKKHEAFYRGLRRVRAEPTIELGLQWVKANRLPDERPVCVGFGDVGPNQFLFEGDDLISIIDIEYVTVGDPLMEMGMMRGRDVTYHTGRMADHMRHYGATYEKLTGIPLSLPSLQYWTIAGPALWNVFTVAGTQVADPEMVDAAFLYAYEVQQKRCILEGLIEQYNLKIERPELPAPVTTTQTPLHELLVAQFDKHYGRVAVDQTERDFARYSKAIAESVQRADGVQLELERANLDELSAVLGHTIKDLDAGMAELETLIAADHMRDLEKRVSFLHRFEVRREYLYEPMQIASGVSHAFPIGRMDRRN